MKHHRVVPQVRSRIPVDEVPQKRVKIVVLVDLLHLRHHEQVHERPPNRRNEQGVPLVLHVMTVCQVAVVNRGAGRGVQDAKNKGRGRVLD